VLGAFVLHCDNPDLLAFCDNETNHRRLFGIEGASGHFKDGLHDYIVHGAESAINPAREGTKVGAVWQRTIPPHQELEFRLRLSRPGLADPFDGFDETFVRCQSIPLKIRSLVGLVPLFAVETLSPELLEPLPGFRRRMDWFLQYRPDLAALISRWKVPGAGSQHLLSLLRGHRMKRLLRRMLDESEFLSDFGIRALSKYHQDHPYRLEVGGTSYMVNYQPGESDSGLFGGNSNWRGPIWMPVNYLLVESLQKFHAYYGNDFVVECPTGSGVFLNLAEIANELSSRLLRLFLPDEDGRRPSLGPHPKYQSDPNFRDHCLFYEYFHGDNGRGIGASHQTGWTGLVATLLSEAGLKHGPSPSEDPALRIESSTSPQHGNFTAKSERKTS